MLMYEIPKDLDFVECGTVCIGIWDSATKAKEFKSKEIEYNR